MYRYPAVCVSDNLWTLPDLLKTIVAVGTPKPISEYLEGELDLNEELITNAEYTFGIRVTGYFMVQEGIYPGDLLIVDRSLEPTSQDIVVVVLDGALAVKCFSRSSRNLFIVQPDGSHAGPQDEIWGVVVHTIHKLR